MKLNYFGHSCFSVETGGKHLLFDPFIRPNELAAGIDPTQIAADVILISHGHFDHVADAVEIAKRTGALVISNYEIYEWFGKQGLTSCHPMNLGGSHSFEFGNVKMVPALHSSVLPDGTYGGSPGGFVVSNAGGAFYYAGDTALTLDMQLIAQEFSLDFAVLPIGDNFTMGVTDAVRAAKLLACNHIVGVHYDTFPPIVIDHAAAVETFNKSGLSLRLPPIGGTITLKE